MFIHQLQKLLANFRFDIDTVGWVEIDNILISVSFLSLGHWWVKFQFVVVTILVQLGLIQWGSTFHFAEILDNLLLIARGMFLMILGGWFDLLCT